MIKRIIIFCYFSSLSLVFFFPPWLCGRKEYIALMPVNTLINIFQRPLLTSSNFLEIELPLQSIDMNLLLCRIGFLTTLFGALYIIADYKYKKSS